MIDPVELKQAKDLGLPLSDDGRLIDYLDTNTFRPNTPEERNRQSFVRSLVEEYAYPATHVRLERQVQIGRELKRADIVIYNSARAAQRSDQGQVFLIVETKAPSEKEPDGQLTSYVSASSAQGGVWSNGDRQIVYRKDPSTGTIEEFIGLPRFEEDWSAVGRFTKADLIAPVNLKTVFRRCHNALYSEGIDSEDIALDMVRVLLAKLEDETSAQETPNFYITQDEYRDSTRHAVAANRVRKLFAAVRQRYPDVFSPSEELAARDKQLAIILSQLQKYSLLDASYDVIGTAYETYVADNLKGERGQFFTNRLVVHMMIEILDPTEKDVILDPACGTGGFLLAAMNYIFRKIDSSARSTNARDVLKRQVVHQLFGVDVSKKLVKIAKANMLVGKDGHGGIERADSLAPIVADDLSSAFVEKAGIGKPTVILTNPPFGAGAQLRVKDATKLSQFQTGHRFTKNDDGKIVQSAELNENEGVPPEVLFLERCVAWLPENGRLGIVMAKGQLDNRESLLMRDFILRNTQVLAVVNLHEDTFEPYCGSKASVIFLKKSKRPPENYKIFMAISKKVGQTSRGEPILKRDALGNFIKDGKDYILDEDLSHISNRYKALHAGSFENEEYTFVIQRSELNADTLSLNPIQYTPASNEAVQAVLRLGESEAFKLERLGDIGRVFNGPRFKRPYAEEGATGEGIRRYYTGTALTQLHGENIKYLDERLATPVQRKQLQELTIYRGWILISDSGTLGRVTYALQHHDNSVATNNLIRVVIDDEPTRGYVYQFLQSELGQTLLLKNAYGTNQEHLEPDVVADILIPLPKDELVLKRIGTQVIQAIEGLERYSAGIENARDMIGELLVAE